ncbi:MAG TPA: VWA domain-containing protein [bacterium]|nr:VWA domain-containing protein [bacterium]
MKKLKKWQRSLTFCYVFVFLLQMCFSGLWPLANKATAQTIDTDLILNFTVSAVCGNGITEVGEQCDDGNSVDADACRNNCTLPGTSICEFDLDLVLVMDRSASMSYSSSCEWWQLKCKNKPSCSLGYEWVKNIDYNQTKSWCDARNQSAPHNSVWTNYSPVKMVAAKQTANSFLNLLGVNDQSALVSFATNVTLDKQLSNNHALTQTAVNNLVTVGATNIGDALKSANNELTSARINPLAEQIMILLTDGMANKPSGPGFGEYAPDVAYALTQADAAALAGIKIFTIGLGADINATMLEQIATKTGGKYYFSPTALELQDIFAQIALDVCKYGTISGCKYEDVNNNGQIDAGEPTIADWEINLTNETTMTQKTDALGCFKFINVPLGNYTLSEGAKTGVISKQTYPIGNYSINLTGAIDLVGYDFANYLPNCGNNLVDTGYVGYTNEECDDGNSVNDDACTNSCQLPICGDGILNNSEECDDGNNINDDGCSNQCLLPSCGDGIVNLDEPCDDGNQSNADACLNNCSLPTCGDGYVWGGHELCDDNGNNGQACTPDYSGSCTYCSNSCQPITLHGPYCGDGIKNNGEECDGVDGVISGYTCTTTCHLERLPYCGDGVVNQTLEQCDDGNTNNSDACQNNCSLPSMCHFDLDVMMVIDRSASMDYSSRCDWWQLKCKNKPSCSLGYEWVQNTTYNQSQDWCLARNQSSPHQAVWTEYNPVKFTASKDTANNFLSLMSLSDQSGLISFANDAVLNQQLSNNHPATKTALNGLIAVGATNIGDAIKLAKEELTSARINPLAEQIIILLTDGRANKPAGPGFGEYAPDVAYALAQADVAASLGIKIFTIGLDSEINATMLQEIATKTGGQYYFAPTSAELDEVFQQLKAGVCQSGPSAYCGDNIKNNNEECDNTDGVSEHYQCTSSCTLEYIPYCGDSLINQTTEICDNDAPISCTDVNGYVGTSSCTNECGWGLCQSTEFCGDGVKNGLEECDNTAGVSTGFHCTPTCILEADQIIPACSNGVDDDGDLFIDANDSGCHSDGDVNNSVSYDPNDNDETDMTPIGIQAGDVIINEVAWMGTTISSSDEWLELRNMTGQDIDLTGWTLNAQDGAPAITLSGTLLANGYFLLERTDETTVPDITADQIYSGALSDSGEVLDLKDNSSNLIDTAGSLPWIAGDGPAKKTMERGTGTNWQTSLNVGGTPKAVNSL